MVIIVRDCFYTVEKEKEIIKKACQNLKKDFKLWNYFYSTPQKYADWPFDLTGYELEEKGYLVQKEEGVYLFYPEGVM